MARISTVALALLALCLTAGPGSPQTVHITGVQRRAIFPDEPLNIHAEADPQETEIASFEAYIRPDGSDTPVGTIPLADDGAAPDGTAGDRRFSGQWPGSDQLGGYQIDLVAVDGDGVPMPVSAAASFLIGHTIVSTPDRMLISPEELPTSRVPLLIEDDGTGFLAQRQFKSTQLEVHMWAMDADGVRMPVSAAASFLGETSTQEVDIAGTVLDGLPGTFATSTNWDYDFQRLQLDASLIHTDWLSLGGGPGASQETFAYVDLEAEFNSPGHLAFNVAQVFFDDSTDGVATLGGNLELGRGDVDGNRDIHPFDASLVLMHTVTRIDLNDPGNARNDPVEAEYGFTLPDDAGYMADVSGEQGISALDAAYILQRVVETIAYFPAEEDYYRLWAPPAGWWDPPTPGPAKPVGAPAFAGGDVQEKKVSLGAAEERADGTLVVPVLIDEMDGVLAGGFAVEFDARQVRIEEVRGAELTRDFLFADHVDDGVLRVGFAGAAWRSGTGALAEMRLYPLKEGGIPAGTLRLTEVQLNEGRLPVHVDDSFLPQALALHPNFPNPFNPSTTLRFDLPRAGQVRLSIYNVVGQRVRTLVHGRREAGYYRVEWDGMDQAGRPVGSGTYLARLQTEAGVQMQKMLMVK